LTAAVHEPLIEMSGMPRLPPVASGFGPSSPNTRLFVARL
jgi:hypothetical protein